MRKINLQLVELDGALEYRRYLNKKGDEKSLLKNVEYVFSTEGIGFSCSLYVDDNEELGIIEINGEKPKDGVECFYTLEGFFEDELKNMYNSMMADYGFLPSYRAHDSDIFKCVFDLGFYNNGYFSEIILGDEYLILLGRTDKAWTVTQDYDESFYDDINIIRYKDIKDVDLAVSSKEAIIDLYVRNKGAISIEIDIDFNPLSEVVKLRRVIKEFLFNQH